MYICGYNRLDLEHVWPWSVDGIPVEHSQPVMPSIPRWKPSFLAKPRFKVKKQFQKWWEPLLCSSNQWKCWNLPLISPLDVRRSELKSSASLASSAAWNRNWWLVGGIPTPLKNTSQLGSLVPIYGKNKNVPNHQPDGLCIMALWCDLSDFSGTLSGKFYRQIWILGQNLSLVDRINTLYETHVEMERNAHNAMNISFCIENTSNIRCFSRLDVQFLWKLTCECM